MKNAADMGNSLRLFHLIRISSAKALDVNETICEFDSPLIHNR